MGKSKLRNQQVTPRWSNGCVKCSVEVKKSDHSGVSNHPNGLLLNHRAEIDRRTGRAGSQMVGSVLRCERNPVSEDRVPSEALAVTFILTVTGGNVNMGFP